MIKVGIIGLGHVAKHQVAAIRRSHEFQLVAGCDPDPGRFELLGPDVGTYIETEPMLERSDIDVVIVATPNKMHVDLGIQVLDAGKWLVMEKPLAETPSEFERLATNRAEHSGRCTLALHAAFGVEVDWFCSGVIDGKYDAFKFTSFAAQFYDPYFENGKLQRRASSLGGSWMDSGINAFSVLCRLVNPDCVSISDSRMTWVAGAGCLEVQGTVSLKIKDQLIEGNGTIDTNWTIGRNQKVSKLGMSNGGELVLDHSTQSVVLREGAHSQVLFSCENDLPRLTNHYIGVFADLAQQMEAGQDNFGYCQKLHKFLYAAEYWDGSIQSP